MWFARWFMMLLALQGCNGCTPAANDPRRSQTPTCGVSGSCSASQPHLICGCGCGSGCGCHCSAYGLSDPRIYLMRCCHHINTCSPPPPLPPTAPPSPPGGGFPAWAGVLIFVVLCCLCLGPWALLFGCQPKVQKEGPKQAKKVGRELSRRVSRQPPPSSGGVGNVPVAQPQGPAPGVPAPGGVRVHCDGELSAVRCAVGATVWRDRAGAHGAIPSQAQYTLHAVPAALAERGYLFQGNHRDGPDRTTIVADHPVIVYLLAFSTDGWVGFTPTAHRVTYGGHGTHTRTWSVWSRELAANSPLEGRWHRGLHQYMSLVVVPAAAPPPPPPPPLPPTQPALSQAPPAPPAAPSAQKQLIVHAIVPSSVDDSIPVVQGSLVHDE